MASKRNRLAATAVKKVAGTPGKKHSWQRHQLVTKIDSRDESSRDCVESMINDALACGAKLGLDIVVGLNSVLSLVENGQAAVVCFPLDGANELRDLIVEATTLRRVPCVSIAAFRRVLMAAFKLKSVSCFALRLHSRKSQSADGRCKKQLATILSKQRDLPRAASFDKNDEIASESIYLSTDNTDVDRLRGEDESCADGVLQAGPRYATETASGEEHGGNSAHYPGSGDESRRDHTTSILSSHYVNVMSDVGVDIGVDAGAKSTEVSPSCPMNMRITKKRAHSVDLDRAVAMAKVDALRDYLVLLSNN